MIGARSASVPLGYIICKHKGGSWWYNKDLIVLILDTFAFAARALMIVGMYAGPHYQSYERK